MPQETRLVVLLAALTLSALSACDSGSSDDSKTDSGPKKDSGGDHEPDATAAADSSTPDATTGPDAGSPSDAGKSDAASGDAGGGLDGGKTISSIHGGSISVLDGGTSTAKGAALLVRTAAGHALVSLQVSGLGAAKAYPAHVHTLPCAMYAGGHYQHVADAGATADNEIWPVLMTDDAGQARAYLDVNKVVRNDAVAVVVHDPDMANAKMLCADLATKMPFATSGAPVALAGAADAGVAAVTGTASLTRTDDGSTQATISVTKLKPDTDYMAHVHDQPCAFASGGGHYKFNYEIDASAPVESNEIWLNFKSDATGAGTKTTTITNHVARAEAQAIVIHAMDGTRLACIDLKL